MAEGKLEMNMAMPAGQFLSIIKRSGESVISMLRTDEVISAKHLAEDDFSTGGSKVVIYTSEGCPWCARMKQYLKSKGILSFKELKVSRNPSAVHAGYDTCFRANKNSRNGNKGSGCCWI